MACGLLAATLGTAALWAASPVGAQEDVPASDAEAQVNSTQQEIDAAQIDIVRDDDTSDTIQRIRRDLAIVAVALTVALAIYIWHTNPSRRLRVAGRHAGLFEGWDRRGPDNDGARD